MAAFLMMAVFLLLDRPCLPMKKTICCYVLFGVAVVTCFSVWYALDWESFVRFAGMLTIPVIGVFCTKLSRETIYVSLYKLTLGFYLISVTVFCGIDAARLWFSESIWADLAVRSVLMTLMIAIIAWKVRTRFLEGIDYVREEMDWFSTVTVFFSILTAALVAFWPGTHVFSMFHVVRTVILFLMAGIIQFMVYKIYFHRGRERRYQVENELLETNERLISRQLELMRESREEAARIRHDVRHHSLLIEKYIRNGENDKLLAYVKQYRDDVESRGTECICGNETISNILSLYARQAKKEGIEVTMHVRAAGDVTVRDIDLVAVIANVFENAIHGCQASGKSDQNIFMSVDQKGKKIVVQCRNTCSADLKFKNGVPQSDSGKSIGISSILKVVSYYRGEAEFSVKDGMFITKILLHIMGRNEADYEKDNERKTDDQCDRNCSGKHYADNDRHCRGSGKESDPGSDGGAAAQCRKIRGRDQHMDRK